MNKVLLCGLAILVLLTWGCCPLTIIDGSGNVTEESRDVVTFHRLSLSSQGEVIVVQTGQESLTIEIDDNLFEHIRSEVRDGTLYLGLSPLGKKAVLRTTQPIRFRVNVKTLDSIAVSGSGLVRAAALETEILKIEVSGPGSAIVEAVSARSLGAAVSGSGQIQVGGAVATQAVTVSGSGNYRAANLRSVSASAIVSSSGSATLWAADALTAEVSGSGTIFYYGAPTITESISGSGGLKALGPRNVPF